MKRASIAASLFAAVLVLGCKKPVPPEVASTLEKARAWRAKAEQIVAAASKSDPALPSCANRGAGKTLRAVSTSYLEKALGATVAGTRGHHDFETDGDVPEFEYLFRTSKLLEEEMANNTREIGAGSTAELDRQLAGLPEDELVVYHADSWVEPKVLSENTFSDGTAEGRVMVFDVKTGKPTCQSVIKATTDDSITTHGAAERAVLDSVATNLVRAGNNVLSPASK